jgi:hypothetical protein
MTVQTPPASDVANPGDSQPRIVGQVVYMYAFDIAYDMRRQPIQSLMGHAVEQFVVDASKRSPKQLFFYRPQMLRLPPLQRAGPYGPVSIDLQVKLLPVGALSIRARVPFSVAKIDELVRFHDLRFDDGTYLYDEVRKLADDVRKELHPYLDRPVAQLPDEEAYTVFCIHGPAHGFRGQRVDAEDWLIMNRRQVAALLTEEPDPGHLSDQESDETTRKSFSYFEDDLVVIDWDAAVMIDEPRNFEEVLYIMELANVQLAELEAYDRMLDEAVDRAYRDLRPRRFARFRNTVVQRELREIRIDMARLSDELSNITKFFGDWHLARIYQGLADRFHLSDWHRIIDEKLKTLDDLYQIIRSDMTNNLMLTLEIAVVILFVIELVNSILHWAR